MTSAYKIKTQQGFTLMELMVVMTIITLLTGLVGPMTINSLEKAEAKSELLTIKGQLRKISYRSYILQSASEVTFKGHLMTVKYLNSTEESLTFEQKILFFDEQVLYFNSYGFVSPLELSVAYREQKIQLDLAAIINTSEVPDES
ncbi:type II secretion system protein [Pseudoalteromonas gelatinilytica]